MTLPFDEPRAAEPARPAGARRLVVEADGGSRGNPGPAAYGALVRDPATRQILVERAEYLGETTNNVAEYSGLVAGLEAAREIDPGARVEVRMDSKLVVEQMSGRWKIKHEDMRRLALQARAILPREQVSYVWVPRSQNGAADRLANLAMDAAAKGQRWEPPPGAYADDAAGALTGGAEGFDEESTAEMSDPTPDPASPPPERLSYRLLSGTDDRAFCEKVSAALADGYQLHGSPSITHDGSALVVAQAVVDRRLLGFGS